MKARRDAERRPSVVRRWALVAASLSAACGADSAAVGPLDAPTASPLDRPDTPGSALQFRFDPDDLVERFASPSDSFVIHFARDGRNAVPGADADGSGIPDYVEEVAGVYDEALAHYRDVLGFRPPRSDEALPDNGGDGRFDVYLVDFGGVGDGVFRIDGCSADNPEICAGFMTQENDYRGYGYPSTLLANRILGSHEFFHAVQAAYDTGQGTVMAEGTAVWATESFDPSLRDFEGFIDGYLANCDRPLDLPLPGPVDPFSYGSALFFQFLEERYGEGSVRSLWERSENGQGSEEDPSWFKALDPLLASRAQTTFAEAFVDFAAWNLFTGRTADPARSYDAGAGYPALPLQEVAAPYSSRLRVFYSSAQYVSVPPGGRAAMTAALAVPPEDPAQRDGLALLLTTRSAATYGDIARADDLAQIMDPIATAGVDSLVVIVVNGLQEGDSRKPTLCIGTADEVDACRAAVEGGAGVGGGGGAGDGGSAGGDAVPPDALAQGEDGDCGCRLTSPAGATSPYGLGLSLLALALRRHGSGRRLRGSLR